MRKIILLMGMSVDGYNAGGWFPREEIQRSEVLHEIWNQLASIDTFIMGRVSYQLWFDVWPGLRDSESQFEATFSRFADDVEKIVISNTLTASEWRNSSVIGGDIRSKLIELKQQPGKDIAIVGGAKVAQTIGKLDLIDEYRLWLRPVILGKGTSLFDTPSKAVDVTLIEAKTFRSGLIALHYTRADKG